MVWFWSGWSGFGLDPAGLVGLVLVWSGWSSFGLPPAGLVGLVLVWHAVNILWPKQFQLPLALLLPLALASDANATRHLPMFSQLSCLKPESNTRTHS
jgi:hypothetical protein